MPAAGTGQRFGDTLPKQYAPLRGRTVIEHALAPVIADPRCRGIVVALAADDPHWDPVAARLEGPSIRRAEGGAQRAHSVRNALAALEGEAASDDWVAVHDAARPCLDAALLDRVLAAAQTDRIGALLAIPVADTLKRGAGCAVEETVDRSSLWAAQTPQVFRYGELCRALDAALSSHRIPTDESQAMEWMGRRPRLVEGSARNLKITSRLQLGIAEALLAS